MTLDDFLTLPLHGRIEWLRKSVGSHDKLAAKLGTKRQTVIGWEKGAQPNAGYRAKLAEVSGFPAHAFQRTPAEQEVWALTESRLRELEGGVREIRQEVDRIAGDLERLRTGGSRPHGAGEPPSQASEV